MEEGIRHGYSSSLTGSNMRRLKQLLLFLLEAKRNGQRFSTRDILGYKEKQEKAVSKKTVKEKARPKGKDGLEKVSRPPRLIQSPFPDNRQTKQNKYSGSFSRSSSL